MKAGEPHSDALDVRVLGALELYAGDRRLEIAGGRTRGLVGLLARSVGRPVATTEIVRQVWGLEEKEARKPGVRNAVQARVSSLRRVLNPSVLCAVPGGYLLDLPGQAVDSARFETALSEARGLGQLSRVEGVAEAYRRALAQWRSESAYTDVRHVPALAEEGDRLGELRLQALKECLAAEVDAGAYDTAAVELMTLTRRHPQVEEFWALRMLTLSRLERQADGLAVYQEARRVLADRFGLVPGARLQEMERLILRGTGGAVSGAKPAGPTSIGRPATSFLGREGEVDATLKLLGRTRILTLIGLGGVGKTRLALEVSQALIDRRAPAVAHDVVVVDLVPYAPGDDLALAVLDALSAATLPGGTAGRGRSPVQMLCDALKGRRVLVVLDNCEHVADGAAALCAALNAGTEATTILATSRQQLGVPGEAVYPVAPLAVPTDLDDVVAVAGLPAVRLFLDRAQAVQPGLTVDAAGVRTISRVCRQLDGIPLAIELAAVRVGVGGLAGVERLLDDRFRQLDRGPGSGPDRHRTLESVVGWSYQLLDRREQQALGRLSVFRGSFLPQQVRGMWTRLGEDDTDVPALLGRLAARSMVQAEAAEGFPERFRLLETVRLYAARKLEAMGGTERVVRAQVDVFVSLAISCSSRLVGAGQAQAVRTFMLEEGNIRAAFQRALDRGLGDVAHQLAGALGYTTWMRGGRTADWELITRSLALPAQDVEIRVRALAWAANLGSIFGHLREAVHFGEQAEHAARGHESVRIADLALAYAGRAHALHRLGRWEQGDAVLEEARRLALSSGDRWTMAAPSMVRGLGMLARGRTTDAETAFLTAAEHYSRCADNWAQQRALLRRAMTREARGDLRSAAVLLAEAVQLVEELDLPEAAVPAKAALARVTLLAGHIDAGRHMVDELTRSNTVLSLDAPAAQLAQCKAILADVDGRSTEAIRRHLDAGVGLADVGLFAEAAESWARVVLLAEQDSPQFAAAVGAAEQVAARRESPRVLAIVRYMRGLRAGSDSAAADELAAAEGLFAQNGLGLPALLRRGGTAAG
ncbi:BTAD domain-containing putative transcriptional regulator [Streptomyces sp. ME19-01-6]|uniref:BTAD domain-containing putative transcriptional regulator n=1 Tax=Streptomyces sp. ME19-01-6 TaxID=3028686 RepID=UPI0029B4314D|nr:BTAD domain-containing putative transcriptional regulator [Streptomyces sp. ME19-01-6]MDX3233841.1 BTAD domain-containing putative transcriptional regulator [Streptomyces sp. ME19-01-6]